MSEKKTHAVLNFFKRNLYYLIIGIALIVTAIVIAAVLLSRNASNVNTPTVEKTIDDENNEQNTPNDTDDKENGNTDDNGDGENQGEKGDGENQDDTPTDSKIVFMLPVANSNIFKEYTSSTVVYNQTLGVYTGHMGLDFSANEGTAVVAAYAGTVESITSNYLQGTTITIDHGNGLKSIYNSIEADENLVQGSTVTAGQVIGTVSDNNRQEYKDGPHLHFEVTMEGQRVDPETYLMIAEK